MTAVATFPENLTPRELEIARLVGEGLDGPSIAEMTGVKNGTIKQHLARIRLKAGVETTVALCALMWKCGAMVQPEGRVQ